MGQRTKHWLRLPLPIAASLGLLAGVALGWSQGIAMPFTVPMGQAQNPKVWNGPPTKRVGIKVKVTSGVVRAEGPADVTLGQVVSGTACLFEGNFADFNVIAQGQGPATGSTVISQEGAIGDTSRLIGSDSTTLPLPGGGASVLFYASSDPLPGLPRLATVRAGTNQVSVTGGSGVLVGVDPGDWTFCSKTTTKYGLTGSGTADWAVFDMPSAAECPAWEYSGTASRQQGDTGDAVYVDGTANLTIRITNTGTSDITVSCTGAAVPPSNPVVPGAFAEVTGTLTSLYWMYTGAGGQVTILVKKP